MNHKHTWDLIPWLINGTATDNDRHAAERHMTGCQACREELDTQRYLLQAMRIPQAVEMMPHGSLQKLWERIDAEPVDAETAATPELHSTHPSRLTGWLAAAVVLQAALLGVLSMALLGTSHDADEPAEYRTVSAQSEVARAPSVRAVFSPSLTLGELQALLERTRLRIVNGPSPDGVYTLATLAATADAQQALLALRAHPGVQFAEPIAAARAP
jgi:anti-sigma factor RsiW